MSGNKQSAYVFTITTEHIEPDSWRKRNPSRWCHPGEWSRQAWKLRDAIGRVLPGDVGKRVFECLSDDGSGRTFYQVENDQQRDARIQGRADEAATRDASKS